ncbi:MAG: molybdopterin-dependent oxidoreductase [Chloroflexi bacterium]|nr:molybdopterin-dependent oxidoreductase [Chloroflexota bacterium]
MSIPVQATADDQWVSSVCYMCFNCCGIKAHKVNNTIVKIEGDPDNPHNWGKICAKGNAGLMNLYNPQRVKTPLHRTNPRKGIGIDPQWVEISWDEALDEIAQKLKKIRAEDPRKLAVISEDFNALPVRILSAFYSAFGTPNRIIGGAAFFCGNALHPVSFLNHGAFFVDVDLDYCNYCILVGAESGFSKNSTAMLMTTKMADARMRGMKLVVVDPMGSNAAAKADDWLPIRPGTDGALALAMLNILLNELGIYDGQFLKRYTNAPYLIGPDGYYVRDRETQKPLVWNEGGAKAYDAPDLENPTLEGSYTVAGVEARPAFQLLREHVKGYSPEKVSSITTIPAETIRRIAREFGEAARIGSTIVIGGKELPYRPVAVNFSRGAGAHKHAMLTGLAIHMLNTVVGAIDVPGGILGCNTTGPNFWGDPLEGPDGIIVSPFRNAFLPYPAREVKPPETLTGMDLFPVASFADPMLVVNMRNPQMFKMPYKLEAVIQCRSNIMISTGNPEDTAQWLKDVPFMVSFTRELDETAEFADIVLPDSHYLERLDMYPNHAVEMIQAGMGYWYYEMRQPVVDPPQGVRHWMEVLLEIAERVGILGDLYSVWNVLVNMKDPFKLDSQKKYTWEEIADRLAKNMFGPEHGVEWFKAHGFVQWPKKVEEAYPRPFLKPRIPLYLEHFQKAGVEVKRATEEMGIAWDTSDYQPLPDWKPCPAYEEGDPFDLYAINYKLPFHTFSYTVQNPWLNDLAEHHPYAYNVVIHTQAAKKAGVKDGDTIVVESSAGDKVKGKARVSECIHPEVVGIAGTFGKWATNESIARGKGVHFNRLLRSTMERIDLVSSALDACVKVKIYKDKPTLI